MHSISSQRPSRRPGLLIGFSAGWPSRTIDRIFRLNRVFILSDMRRLSLIRLVVAAGLTAAAALPIATPTTAVAQQKQRTVEGKVIDGSDGALKGAVVYLKDTRTQSVKSFITSEDGAYRFGQLSQNTDYELWAVHEGKKSNTKTVSSFDSKNAFQINLKVN